MNRVTETESKLVGEVTAHGLAFSEVDYPAHFHMSAHRHAAPQLVLILCGSVEHQVQSHRHCFSEQTGGLVAADESHSDLFMTHTRAFHVSFVDSAHNELAEACQSQAFHRNHVGTKLLGSIYRGYQSPDKYTPAMLESLTFELLVHLQRQPVDAHIGERPQWLDRARELLHEEFSDALRLADIARRVGVHPAHLTKAFRQRFGMSVGEYVRQLRIARSRHLLEVSDMSIGQIALETGFADQGHFTRTFRKYTGLTPRSCRGMRD